MKLSFLRKLIAALTLSPLLLHAAQTQAPPLAEPVSGAAVVLPADIPVRRDASSDAGSGGQLVYVVWSALAIGSLIWVVVRRAGQTRRAASLAPSVTWHQALARLWVPAPAAADLRVLGSTRLDAHHSVHVVCWNDKSYLIGCSENGLSLLDSKDASDSPPKGPDAP